jgi:hypothetical protein
MIELEDIEVKDKNKNLLAINEVGNKNTPSDTILILPPGETIVMETLFGIVEGLPENIEFKLTDKWINLLIIKGFEGSRIYIGCRL